MFHVDPNFHSLYSLEYEAPHDLHTDAMLRGDLFIARDLRAKARDSLDFGLQLIGMLAHAVRLAFKLSNTSRSVRQTSHLIPRSLSFAISRICSGVYSSL